MSEHHPTITIRPSDSDFLSNARALEAAKTHCKVQSSGDTWHNTPITLIEDAGCIEFAGHVEFYHDIVAISFFL